MLQDAAIMGGKDFMTEIYVGICNNNTITILDEKGSIKGEIIIPVALNHFAVNPYREMLTVETSALNDFVYITRPGESMRQVGIFNSNFIKAICPSLRGDFYLAAFGGSDIQIFKLPKGLNECQHISSVNSTNTPSKIWSVQFKGNEMIYFYDTNVFLWLSSDGGNTFQNIYSGEIINDIVVYGDTIFFAINYAPYGLYYSTDGINLVQSANYTYGAISALHVHRNRIFAASYFMYFSDDGVAWQQGEIPESPTPIDLASDPTGTIYILTSIGLYKSDDGGIFSYLWNNNLQVIGSTKIQVVTYR